ncbi:hypothetical protein PMKS-003185 [Pichia membranifaciens]|uniref:NAA35-like N-terminal domain-containing protein n=1 Tax=Pichia membranifaciens TaxID=4926 RepID=A0A1Q2YJY9_9ASCO|nr:hypothetical protein PMKS-003185 [Pichia membranifaciens]
MADLIPSLESFKISNQKLRDVTDEFFKVTSTIEYSKIVKSNNFSLLHGTHALELLNPRLDTFLLQKSEYCIEKDLDLIEATSIISTQLKCLTCWLGQNVGVPNSLLSSEYISRILESYTRFGNFESIPMRDDSWRTVVFKFSILMISTAKFILNLALKSQIYEDEDINTNTMNLNWFFELSNNDIFKLTLISNKTWTSLKSQISTPEDVKYFHFIKESFQILQTLSSLDSIFQWEIPLFSVDQKHQDFHIKFSNKLTQMEKIVEKLNGIDLIDMDSIQPPVGSFNSNAQIKFDNQSPPKELLLLQTSWNDCTLNLTQLFNDLIDVMIVLKSKNIIEFVEWLKYLESKRNNTDSNEINGLHIIARIVFYSLMNNNQTSDANLVFNIKNLTFKDLFWTYLKDFSLKNSRIDNEMNSNKRNKNAAVLEQVDYYLDAISLFWKESVMLPTLNPSRQRQFKCKELKYWNMRQSESGSLEDYFINLNFYRANEKVYPLTFTIIFFKLKSISEVILKSIELNLFKDVREYLSVYYQLILISSQLNQQINDLILMANANNNNDSVVYLSFLKNENSLIYQLSIMKAKQFEILSFLGFNILPRNLIQTPMLTPELLYKLQWKQFHNITDPEMLSFKEVQDRLHQSKTLISDVNDFEKVLTQEMNGLVNEFTKSTSLCNALIDKMRWFKELKDVKTLKFNNLLEELTKTKLDTEELLQFVKKSNNDRDTLRKDYMVNILRLGRYSCFPGVKLNKKN